MLAKINYLQNAHRLSLYDVDESVTEIYSGQLFQLNDEGKWVYADGTKKAYHRPCGNAMWKSFEKTLKKLKKGVDICGMI